MKKALTVLIIIILLVGIAVGVYLVKRQQILKSKATVEGTRIEVVDTDGSPIITTSFPNVKLKLTYVVTVATPSAAPSPSATSSASLTPPLIESTNSAVQGIAYAQAVFPTHFRVANTRENLVHASERLFDSNPKLIDWQLLEGNGSKTVYAQFKINNTWSDIYSASIQLTNQPPITFEMGMEAGQQFDTSKVDLVAQSNALWVRLNFIVRDSWSGVGDPQFISTYNSIIDAYTQKGIKIIGLIGAESVKQGFDRNNPSEFITRLVDVADKITETFGDRVKVYELFNEPNDYAGGTNSQLTPGSFANLLKSVYQKVKIDRNRTGLTLVSGPIFSHNLSNGGSGDTGEDYLRQIYTSGINQSGWEDFKNQQGTYPLDALGLHIYIDQGLSQRVVIEASIRRNLEGIKRVIREFDPDKKIWISEMGWGTGVVSEAAQADNLETAFNVLKNDPVVRMAMWFTLRDFDSAEYGLIRTSGAQKPAFQRFIAVASQLRPSPSPTVSPSASSSASPRPGKNPDFNGDRKVNSVDIALLFRQWRSTRTADLNIYDLNNDGVINSFDYAILRSNFSP